MPIYEYRCRECGGVFEELILRASDEEELVCSHCRSRDVERLLSAVATLSSAGGGGGGCGSTRSPFS